jgi:hypothetical protein
MANVLIEESSLTNIANAIRAKSGLSTTYRVTEMPAAISAISSGGGGGTQREVFAPAISFSANTGVVTATNTFLSGEYSASTTTSTYTLPMATLPTSVSTTSIGTRIGNALYQGSMPYYINIPVGYISSSVNYYLQDVSIGSVTISGNGNWYAEDFNLDYIDELTVSVPGGITPYSLAMKTISGTVDGGSATKVGSYTFYYQSYITSVAFASATTIQNYAFYYCSKLTSYSFPKATTLYAYAFAYCTTLPKAIFPSVTNISSNAFLANYSISEASFGNVTMISTSAFRSCRKLLSLNLTKCTKVPSLGTGVFYSTPISGYTTSTGGVSGSIYVPSSLYSAWSVATNWSAVAARLVSV